MEKSKRTTSVDIICLTEAELADVICEGINEFCSSHKPKIYRIKNIYTKSGFLWVWSCQNADCFGFGGHEKYEDAFSAALKHKDYEEYYEYA